MGHKAPTHPLTSHPPHGALEQTFPPFLWYTGTDIPTPPMMHWNNIPTRRVVHWYRYSHPSHGTWVQHCTSPNSPTRPMTDIPIPLMMRMYIPTPPMVHWYKHSHPAREAPVQYHPSRGALVQTSSPTSWYTGTDILTPLLMHCYRQSHPTPRIVH